ncbi:hypothetical protein HAX54_022950 [Datura stramonium]|uniref:Uncharacterized protein n=1 Tax=Datura stramonium TaxID=4076 RepID=A0ABS8UXD9_DATST|nr:hypothetical protein [Datura stramonium]
MESSYGIEKLIQLAASQLSDQLPESREAARALLLELQNVYEKTLDMMPTEVSEDPKQISWEHFCQLKLTLSAQAVLRATNASQATTADFLKGGSISGGESSRYSESGRQEFESWNAELAETILSTTFLLLFAYDLDPLQDLCVVAPDPSQSAVLVNGKYCKDPNQANPNDFFASGFNPRVKPGEQVLGQSRLGYGFWPSSLGPVSSFELGPKLGLGVWSESIWVCVQSRFRELESSPKLGRVRSRVLSPILGLELGSRVYGSDRFMPGSSLKKDF